MTIFERIAAGEIPASIVQQDGDVLAFHDINPQAPVHILVVPKRLIPRVGEALDSDEAVLGKLLLAARDIAKSQGLDRSGYRLVINNGPDAGEAVPHLHVHLLGGRPLDWPPG
ncbi:MAG: histidine triad nucleotide-binding protein [Chthoniobacterales bacterium]|nr:histidine triad nucleotide-binding protein [Chthoniobacterales bacterium]